MAHTGRPKTPGKSVDKKSSHYYTKRRQQLVTAGYTQPEDADNTKTNTRSVKGKWDRYCRKIKKDPEVLLQNLTAEDVKLWFEWLERNFKYSIKSHGSLAQYWRVLKRLYFKEHLHGMPETMHRDCINYMDKVSRRWNGKGLRRRELHKDVGDDVDLLSIHMTNLVDCESVYPTEKQRFGIFPSLNLTAITTSRAVSLFDTRTKECKERVTQTQCNFSSKQNCGENSTSSNYFTEGSDVDSDMDSDPTDLEDDKDSSDSDMSHSRSILDVADEYEYNSDSDATNDGYLDGDEVTRTLLWRHINFRVFRNPDSQWNAPIAIVSLLHTKREDKKARMKRWLVEHEDHPLFDTLGQLLSMAKNDNAFAAKIPDLEDIYHYDIPEKGYLELKISKDKLDQPVFRTADGQCTSQTKPLKSTTYGSWLKRLGIILGMRSSLTQKVLRRLAIKLLNKYAPASIRDQAADHESNALPYYLDQIVDFDLAAHLFKRSSRANIRALATRVTMMADPTAPRELTDEERHKLEKIPELVRLKEKCQRLGAKLSQNGQIFLKYSAGTNLGKERKRAMARLHSRKVYHRARLLKKARDKHFRRADTNRINQQYHNGCLTKQTEAMQPEPSKPRTYSIPERAEFIKIVREFNPDMTEDEKHNLRVRCMRIWTQWQDRRERPRRGKRRPEPATDFKCGFCQSDKSLPPGEYSFSRITTLWGHIRKFHGLELAEYDSGLKPCVYCDSDEIVFFPESVAHFKRHVKDVHEKRPQPR